MPSHSYYPTSPSASASSGGLTTPSPKSTLGRRPRATSQIPPTINYKFWFDDFHVALVTLDRVAYRVRRDCLESASLRLSRLIAEAIETADKQTSFGCPIVHLDLPSSRLEPFLEVVTDPKGNKKISWLAYRRIRRTSASDEGRLSFSSLAALARTAHELEACETKFAALRRIMHFFKPHSLLSFGMHHESFRDNWEWRSRKCGIRVDVEHAIEALNLSRLLFAAPRFPLALYACCLLSPAQLRRGVARQDGVVEQLSDDDFERCMRAMPLLHIANRDNVVKAFPVEDWQCLEAKRSAFSCEGRDGVRRIRDAYMAHMKAPGPYRSDLRDLFSPLKFKSLPYERLFAPGGKSLICQGCAERLVGISETLCSDEASNLERYFFPEPPPDAGDVDANVNRSPAPNVADFKARTPTPPSDSEPEEPLSPADAEAPRPPHLFPPRPPHSLPPRPPHFFRPRSFASRSSSRARGRPRSTSPPEPESSASPRCPEPPDQLPEDDDDDDGPRPPIGELENRGPKPPYSPRLEIEIPETVGALGWHDGADSDNLLLLGD